MKKNFYITTTLPYVNAEPHVGFALEIVEADVLARFHRSLGEEVVFNTGTDEHGKKILEEAEAANQSPQAYCDAMVAHFRELQSLLGLNWTHFVRTTDPHHVMAAQEFWERCEANGDIYKKQYQTKYCVGCEMEKTDSELVDGHCPLHPNREIELIDEENYFFRFSKYQGALLKLYADNPDFVIPKKRLNEITAFVERGLMDFSISRLKSKLPWGIPVPDDPEHVIYVWFDALVNYISTLGWPACAEPLASPKPLAERGLAGKPDHQCREDSYEQCNFSKFWPGIQIAGKDNLRQQASMWQAMLLSAGLPTSKQILINGFINVGGRKMSKSVGNVILPSEMVECFGVDGTRYLLLSLGPIGEDFDITWEKLTEKYNADLANGLGNLTARILKLAEQITNYESRILQMPEEFISLIQQYRISEALEYIWDIVREDNKYIEEHKPWELAKSDPEKFEKVMKKLLEDLALIAELLAPFLPETSEKIKAMLAERRGEILFKRI